VLGCALIGSEEASAAISEEMEHALSLTRKFLEGMGIDDKQVESIIEAHSETVNGLKADRDKYKEQAGKVADLQKQLEEAQAASDGTDEWEKKYNDEHQAFEDFKAQIQTERADAEKAQAYRGMLMAAGIDPKRIDAIMKVTDLSDVEMEDGKLKDSGKLEESAKEEWADFVLKTFTKGSNPATPPEPKGNVPEGADPEIAKRMQERHERMFGKTEAKE
jgi:hypothetical protein